MLFRELRFLWYSDLYRCFGRADPATFLKMLLVYWEPPGIKYAFLLRLCAYLRVARPRVIAAPLFVAFRILLKHYEYRFHIRIAPGTQIGAGLYIGHFGDIGVNRQAVIGANCNISQGVSIGQASRGRHKGSPIIGDNVFIGPGAKIIGRIRVGNNVAIGANAVVTRDVPDNAVVVGVPGRVISYKGSSDYVIHTDYTDDGAATGWPTTSDDADVVGAEELAPFAGAPPGSACREQPYHPASGIRANGAQMDDAVRR